MAKCPDCHGTGVILLFTSATPCSSCGATGRELGRQAFREGPDYRSQGGGSDGNPITITGGTGASPGGSITIYGGSSTGSGVGGDVTFTTGNATASTFTLQDAYGSGSATTTTNTAVSTLTANFTVGDGTSTWLTANAQGLQFGSANAPQVSMFTGTKAPTDSPPEAPIGSLYIQDDGTSGTVWVKTSADTWSPLSVDQPTTTMASPSADVARALNDVVHGDGFGWVASVIENLDADDPLEELIGGLVPCIAPVSTSIVADLMAMMEQAGHEVTAFVSSPRDFADVRKFERGDHVVWNGKSVTVFGVPFFQSHDIPVGYMAAIGGGRKCVLATICR